VAGPRPADREGGAASLWGLVYQRVRGLTLLFSVSLLRPLPAFRIVSFHGEVAIAMPSTETLRNSTIPFGRQRDSHTFPDL